MRGNVVFVGDLETLYSMKGYKNIFEEQGFEIKECESIGEAKRIEHIDILIVYAFGKKHVKGYTNWVNPPKTIWYTFSQYDENPRNVMSLKRCSGPKELFRKAMSLIDK